MIYRTDRWDRYQWVQYLHSVQGDQDAQRVLHNGRARNVAFESFAREVFARLYSAPERHDSARPEDRWAERMHSELDASADFERLQRSCASDRLAAGTAALAIADELSHLVPEISQDADAIRQQVKGLIDLAKRTCNESAAQEALEAAKADGKAAVQAAVQGAEAMDQHALDYAIVSGVDSASTQVANLDAQLDAFSGFGAGSGFAMPGPEMPADVRAELARTIKASPRLKRIAEIAGRLKAIALHKQRTKADQARSEVTDIGIGNDLDRLLPSELVKLTDPAMAMDFARRYLERGLLQYELSGKEEQGKGPIVMCLDQSSSMDDDGRDEWAKALALALGQVASVQKRKMVIVRFNRRVIDTIEWDGQPDGAEVMRVLSQEPAGGTAFDPPLRKALEIIRTGDSMRKADVVFVTDGEASLSDDQLEAWDAERKRSEVSCYALHVGPMGASGLEAIADQVLHVRDVADDAEAHGLLGL